MNDGKGPDNKFCPKFRSVKRVRFRSSSGIWPDASTAYIFSLVMRQMVLFWKVQSQVMAGLKLSSSVEEPSVARPVQGSPVMFHDGCAFCPSLANTAFSAAAANAKHQPTTL